MASLEGIEYMSPHWIVPCHSMSMVHYKNECPKMHMFYIYVHSLRGLWCAGVCVGGVCVFVMWGNITLRKVTCEC